MPTNSLIITNLTKTYPNGTVALHNVNLTIGTGVYGLLGANGAGKSTLMRIIATLQDADSGSITLGDLDVLKQRHEVRQLLGYLPQEFDVYPKSTAYELLDHIARMKGISDKKARKEALDFLLEKTNLAGLRNKRLGTFSGGMKQRFGIAQALLGNPQLLIVDEPTAGLDPEERNRIYNVLGELSRDIIVILSTHIVSDVSVLCNNMALICLGQVLVEASPQALVDELAGKVYQKEVTNNDIEPLKAEYNVLSVRIEIGRSMLRIYAEADPAGGFSSVQADLDDVYFYHYNARG